MEPFRLILKATQTQQITNDQDDLIIAGYASVELPDLQGDLIPTEALQDALGRFMKQDGYRNVMFAHTSTQIGEVIPEYISKDGTKYETKVDDQGLYIIVKIRKDIELVKEISQLIKEGLLKAFSIGGQVIKDRAQLWGGKMIKVIDRLDLHEISCVFKGANQGAKFAVIKAGCSCPECQGTSPSPEHVLSLISQEEETNKPIVSATEAVAEKAADVATQAATVAPEEQAVGAKIDRVIAGIDALNKSITALTEKMCPQEPQMPEETAQKPQAPIEQKEAPQIDVDALMEKIQKQVIDATDKKVTEALEKLVQAKIEKKSEVPEEVSGLETEVNKTLESSVFSISPSEFENRIRKYREAKV